MTGRNGPVWIVDYGSVRCETTGYVDDGENRAVVGGYVNYE